jgi:hypothetical protein
MAASACCLLTVLFDLEDGGGIFYQTTWRDILEGSTVHGHC